MIACRIGRNGSAQARDDRLRVFWANEGTGEICEANSSTPDGLPILALVPIDEWLLHVITPGHTYEHKRGIWSLCGPSL